jgi:hypothetical protein
MSRHDMTPVSLPGPRRERRRGGFALLITITLLAFLVLLLVSLASLTRVETQVAANNQQLAQARQNALMALNIAVGQLQKYAGPDQRTTARADLANTPGRPNTHWTGVYGSSVAADYSERPETIAAALADPANIGTTGSPARLLNWLVSGNENTAFDPRKNSGDVGDRGQINRYPDPADTASIPFRPAGTVSGLTTTTAAADTTVKITNAGGSAQPARLLVGANSVTSTLDSSGVPVDYVVAPAVDIKASPTVIPGFSGNTDITVGRYAWWVGDEGTKARANLPMAGTDPALSPADKQAQRRNAFSNSTRDAIELMSANTSADLTATRVGSLYEPDQTALNSIISTRQLPFVSGDANGMSIVLKHRFHDISVVSTSVLADSYAGGLKRDLGILLDASYSPAAADPTANTNRLWVPHAGDTTGFTSGFGVPTWRHLRSYFQTRIPTSGADKDKLPVRLPAHDKPGKTTVSSDADHVGAAPVLTYFSLGFRAAPAAIPAPGVEIHMNLYPLVVIWNPYNVTLKAPAASPDGSNFEVGILPGYDGQVSVDLQANIAGTWTSRGTFNFRRTFYGNNGNFIRFRLRCPDIPPGQSLVFSLPAASSGQVYNQRNLLENIEPEPAAYVSVPFRSGPAGTPVNVTIQAGEEALDYRLDVGTGTQSNSFKSNLSANGGVSVYLGEPDNATSLTVTGGANSAANRAFLNPSASNRHWYNAAQDVDWSGISVTLPFQEPGPLVYDTGTSEPAYVFQCQALFSGQGSNAQFNANQFMFSTRWLAQGNLRAVRSGRTRRDNNYNVLFTATAGQPLYTFPWQKFINGPGSASNRTSAGQGHDWLNGAPVDVALFEFPYQDQPLFSVGQLQHANLSLVGAYPAYAIGNSLADFRLVSGGTSFTATPQPAGWQLARVDTGAGAQGLAFLGSDMGGYYDISYLLNRTLWDRYYFSTVPATGTVSSTDPLANPRLLRQDTSVDLQNPDRSAAGLMLAGGFNINSTSEQAWRAVLGGGRQLDFDPEHPDSDSTLPPLKSSFPRFTRPDADDSTPNDVWHGYRSLDDDQIAQLAHNIVAEIRSRGPFVSLADFVNRRLVDNTATAGEDETFRGAIQAAIDNVDASSGRGQFPANDGSGTFWTQDPLITSNGNYVNQTTQYNMGYYGRPQLEGRLKNSTASADAAARPYGNRSAFAPKYITQADVLAKIGAGLAARSDTFTIRSYGEVVNPATQEVTGQAWCEAVVQRTPDYVAASVSPWDTPLPGSADETFGRKFKIISFRWLSSADI